jgi:peptide/nickel transport system substrate-binding protein
MFGETLRHRSFQGLVLFQNDMPLDYVPTLYFGSNYIPSEANGFSGQNYMDFRNADMDAAMLAVQSELDPDKRRLLWKRILDIYADEMPEIPIFFPSSAIITPKWMTGMASDTRYGFFTAWIEDWRPR